MEVCPDSHTMRGYQTAFSFEEYSEGMILVDRMMGKELGETTLRGQNLPQFTKSIDSMAVLRRIILLYVLEKREIKDKHWGEFLHLQFGVANMNSWWTVCYNGLVNRLKEWWNRLLVVK
jgi:hypothetical protein